MAADEPHFLGHRQRLRERILKNPHEAQSYELLELLLGYVNKRCDTKPLAKDLLKHFGSLWGILNAHPTELETIEMSTVRRGEMAPVLHRASCSSGLEHQLQTL